MTDTSPQAPVEQVVTGRVMPPEPLAAVGRFHDSSAAVEELQRLRFALRRTHADIVVWVVRGGPGLCGYASSRKALAALLDVGSSQVQRVMDYALVVERLAAAAGATTIEEIRGIAAATSAGPASTLLKPQLPALVDEILRRAGRDDVDQAMLIGEVVPGVLDAATRAARSGVPERSRKEAGVDTPAPAAPSDARVVEAHLPEQVVDRPAPVDRGEWRVAEPAQAVSVCPHCGGELG
ncbi:hypothetical protein B4N89_46050 [Embleya scabrispora]|uniref:DUF222 domain-containing protein n=1 Tax=Embleya scabrispora TaxID=159449 RepID=A0A1T3NJD2_9ACTN|nr:hypothetical protein [Embleya scabrispora]OPC76838.1 hypothetical protein B4N89_46050 [Embleya scabrispora]